MHEIDTTFKKIDDAVEFLTEKLFGSIDFAVVLGTGLGHLVDGVRIVQSIEYSKIPGFPLSTAPMHKGEIILGELSGARIIFLNGRHHLYEGWSAAEVVIPIRVMGGLGIKNLIITNAAGALNKNYKPGDIMVISDHINMTGQNPLIGPHYDRLGLRFPDMSEPYDKKLRALARVYFDKYNIIYKEGIYVAVSGPSLDVWIYGSSF